MRKLFLVSLLLMSFTNSNAQVDKFEPTFVEDNASACERNSAHFDYLSNLARAENRKIVIIFIAGKNERENINKRRLAYVKSFLEKYKGWKSERIIYARGVSKEQKPRVEFVVGGELWLVSLASKNKTPCLDCCEYDGFYPQDLNKPSKYRF